MAALVAPSQDEIRTVTSYLKTKLHATEVILSPGRDYIRATLPEASAAVLLSHLRPARSILARLNAANKPRLTIEQASDIQEVKSLIHLVWDATVSAEATELDIKQEENGADTINLSRRRRRTFQSTLAPLTSASPNAQKKSYQMPTDLVAKSGKNNTQMVWGTGTYVYSYFIKKKIQSQPTDFFFFFFESSLKRYGYLESDLKSFFSQFQVPGHLSDVSTYGYSGQPGGDNFGEATLDVQYITALSPGVQTFVANTNTSEETEWGLGFGYAFLDFVQTLSSQPQIPNVLSLSLGSLSAGSCSILCEQVQKSGYSEQQCVKYMNTQRQVCMMDSTDQEDLISIEFMKLGARGMTIVAASGDGGSHFSFQPFPDSGIGRALNKISCNLNFPTFPAASPYVTAIGGTSWKGGDIMHPVNWAASGGGFSWRFPRPVYQQAAVNAYLKANSGAANFPPQGAFNATGRAYPDLAALADNVPMVVQGRTVGAGGTSASAPVWGGIFSMINDQRLAKGLPTLGFVNPLLYQIAAQHPGEAFLDITSGNSNCSADGSCCQTGFPTAPGWDPTTGLGSPIWPGLVKYLTN